MSELTDKQKAFVLDYASNGGNATAAAKSAGYSEKSAHEQGRQNLEIPHVQDAIHRELMRQRFRSGAVGINVLIQIANNEKTPAAARVSAARTLLEHAGLVGAAKEMTEARTAADDQAGRVIDYTEILKQIGQAGRGDLWPAVH